MIKNIHIISTDKPSRLQKNNHKKIFLSTEPRQYSDCINQNIYITSDEEIKEGDWRITKWDDILKVGKPENGYEPTGKKIILTTDQDLIKDGVQAIDDEFLEWFVKNPSCERVEVIKDEIKVKSNGIQELMKDEYYRQFPEELPNCVFIDKYKIIIPKEEPCDNCNNEVCCCIIRKQETIEEIAEKYSKNKLSKLGFINGYKLAQERGYSVEEVLIILQHRDYHMNNYDKLHGGFKNPKEWFKQFKKK